MLQKEGEELQILSDKNDSQGLFAALKANCGIHMMWHLTGDMKDTTEWWKEQF